MTAFEQGYKAFLDGIPKEANPFDGEKCPHSRARWINGWMRAMRNKE